MDMPRRSLALTVLALLLGLVYFGLGAASMSARSLTPMVSPLWPAAGVALAAALRWGSPVVPAVFLATLALGVNLNMPFGVDLALAAGNALETLVAYKLLNLLHLNGHSFYLPRDFAVYSALTAAACAAGSALAVAAMQQSGQLAGLSPGFILLTRMMGHWTGMLIVSPLLLLWRYHPYLSGCALPLLEGLGMAGATAALCWALFSGDTDFSAGKYPLSFLLVPLVMWPAVRMGLRETATVLTALAAASLWGTVRGYGPFAGAPEHVAVMILQAFLAVQSIAGITLASAIWRSRDDEAALDAARHQLTLVLDNSPAFIAYVDRTLTYRLVNRHYEEWFGLSADRIIGSRLYDNVWAGSYEKIRPYVEKALAGERAHAVLEVDHPGGGRRWVDFTYTPDRNGQVKGFFVLAVDVTRQKEVEESLRRAEGGMRALNAELEKRVESRTRRLSQVNDELEAFCYSVAHDLRSPLRKMSGFSEAVLHDYGPKLGERGSTYLTRIFEASRRMGHLIDEMLDLSMVTRHEAREEPVDLTSLARAELERLRRGQPDRQVETVVADGLTAIGDPTLLETLLRHLLDNAWKFTSTKPRARIEFGMIPQEPAPIYYVADDGVGFDMSYARKLFTAFERLHGHQGFPGEGIGLAAVQRVVQRHGGRAWAESRPGAGATFYFTLHERSR